MTSTSDFIQLSGIDYVFYRFTKVFAESWPYYSEEISDFHSEVEQWGLKLAAIAPVLKWDWDNDGYLVYVPFENSKSSCSTTTVVVFLTEPLKNSMYFLKYIGQFTRATPKFKSQRLAYRKTPPDQLAAAKSFRTLKIEESLEVSRRSIMPGSG